MIFRQELAEGIKVKYFGARKALIKEGVDQRSITGQGCAIVAVDGFMRGLLSQGDYKTHLKEYPERRVFSIEWVVAMALEAVEVVRGSSRDDGSDRGYRFYSSSPKATFRDDLIPKPLSRKQALNLAKDLRAMTTLGVFLGTKARVREARGEDHLLSLIGAYGGILRVDGATQKMVTGLSNREAANLMRQAQRGGLVIDIR